ncbi:hypothetical protein LWI28_028026 [Acer negundo]|uniref:Transposon Ty3-I Gag-Pol polyprotein n=1 Tax=Acer negundo TaxID=4023 RepID=A0AAD5I8C5_ACENE|nr:hypothetical protein LWI28_028026 [Acer negundo]
MVTKSNGKWRMSVDYTDLNRACPKDSFPLPKIDQLIDSTPGNKLLSFIDAFPGYNQIMMHPSDQDKTSFITGQGLYCYKVMPFGLTNTGATYQRMVNKLFKQQIRRSMEVYIDDMITKSLEAGQHPEDLRQTFQGKKLKWDEQNELAFQALKEYLASPPLLVKPLTGEELQLYLVVSKAATSGALVKECSDGIQIPMYYVSRAFTKSKKNYILWEKLTYVLVTITRKLRPYFQAHTIVVVTNQPLRQFLQRLDVSGRLVLWVLELTQFDIKYKPRSTIKAQALADFVMEFNANPNPITKPDPSPNQTNLNWPEDNKTWILYTNGA